MIYAETIHGLLTLSLVFVSIPSEPFSAQPFPKKPKPSEQQSITPDMGARGDPENDKRWEAITSSSRQQNNTRAFKILGTATIHITLTKYQFFCRGGYI